VRFQSSGAGTRVVVAVVLLSGSIGCHSSPARTAVDVLAPCKSDMGPTDALCGRFDVFENRQAQSGRTIALKIVVWPALSNGPKPDPLFFIAGGPGQGAAKLARQVRELFSTLQAERDLVLVDQRGTGDSGPLECGNDDDSLASLNEPDAAGLARLRRCLAGYEANPRLYTTPIAMDDLDDVRAYLGYERINIYGASYGTRAGLVYLRQHGDHVRTIVLDGVAPPDMRLPLYVPRDAQRAIDRLIADCAADAACAAKYPNLGERVRQLFARLEAAPRAVRLVHPRRGVPETVTVDAALVANLVFGALYSPLTSSMVPELLARAEQDDFQGMLALAMANESGAGSISVGMQMSVVCTEDAPRIAPGETDRLSLGTLFGRWLLSAQLAACEFWPRGELPPDFYEPVRSDVPALVLSGDVDPITPPSWGDAVSAQLTHATHLTAPFTGHGVVNTGCGQRIVRRFVEQGSAQGLDASCLQRLRRPPFFLTPSGGQENGGGPMETPRSLEGTR
jgi:pimeloyl-ACP methyl ester carboxylesterase